MDAQPAQHVDVTNFMPNTTFHVPVVSAAETASVQAATIDTANIGQMRGQVAAVKQDYLDKNATITNYVHDVARATLGHEAGDQLMGQLAPSGGPTHKQAAVTMIDPTGVAGALWSAHNSMQAQNSRMLPDEVKEALDKVLSAIQEASHEQSAQLDQSAPQIPPPPPGVDFSNINAAQLEAFLTRNVAQDPVMQHVEEAEIALDTLEKNEGIAIENDDQVITADKIEASIEAGDTGRLAELAGGTAQAEAIEGCSAYGAMTFSESLSELPKLECPSLGKIMPSVAEVQLAAQASDTAASSLNQEGALVRMAAAAHPSGPLSY
ncbi:MAG: hypothetical protein ACK4VI_03820 [Alphaproteobacteria bacterium]